LKSQESKWWLFNFSLVDELEFFALLMEPINVEETSGKGSRTNDHVFSSSHHQESLVILSRKGSSSDADSGFVFFQLYAKNDGFGCNWIDH
jgi:hypothetical protein